MKQKIVALASCLLLGLGVAIIYPFLPPNWFKIDFLLNLSSVLTVVSFCVTSILSLRIIAVLAQLAAIPYFFLQPTPLWPPVIWTSIFMVVNLVQIGIILWQKRPVVFSPEEEKLYHLAFSSLSPKEFIKLLTLGEWKIGIPGQQFIKKGDIVSYVGVLASGKIVGSINGEKLAEIGEGELLGTASALIGDPSHIDVEFKEESRYIQWSLVDLRQYINKNPTTRYKFSTLINRDLITKLNKITTSRNNS